MSGGGFALATRDTIFLKFNGKARAEWRAPACAALIGSGIGLALWGVVVVAGVDNVLRPLFLQQGIKAPFFVLIIAILCGMASFGPVGLIAGPVLLAFAIQAVEEGNCTYRHHV